MLNISEWHKQKVSMGSSLSSGNSGIQDPSILECCSLHPVAFTVTEEGDNPTWNPMISYGILCLSLGMENIISIHTPLDSTSHLELNCQVYWDIIVFYRKRKWYWATSSQYSIITLLQMKKKFHWWLGWGSIVSKGIRIHNQRSMPDLSQ